MVSEKLGRRYASAVFSAAGDTNAVDRVGSDLSAIAAAFDSDPLMRDFFSRPSSRAARKSARCWRLSKGRSTKSRSIR